MASDIATPLLAGVKISEARVLDVALEHLIDSACQVCGNLDTSLDYEADMDTLRRILKATRRIRDRLLSALEERYSGRVRERLAAYAHMTWAGWMRYLFSKSTQNEDGSVTIPAWAAERWQRQANTSYADLSEEEQASDLAEADNILAAIDTKLEERVAVVTEADECYTRGGFTWYRCRLCGECCCIQSYCPSCGARLEWQLGEG